MVCPLKCPVSTPIWLTLITKETICTLFSLKTAVWLQWALFAPKGLERILMVYIYSRICTNEKWAIWLSLITEETLQHFVWPKKYPAFDNYLALSRALWASTVLGPIWLNLVIKMTLFTAPKQHYGPPKDLVGPYKGLEWIQKGLKHWCTYVKGPILLFMITKRTLARLVGPKISIWSILSTLKGPLGIYSVRKETEITTHNLFTIY